MNNALSLKARNALFYGLRLAFRLAPMPLSTRDRLRQRFLDRYSSLVPPAPRGQPPTDGARVRRPYVRSDERAIGYVPYSKGELPDPLPATLVAFYLPQFHTIPENDEWWGKGFTEWRNVTRALPQFEGHHQPRLPGDLGFYDLRNVEVMREQARLAKEYGIGAFCFYFYWFGGKTLLETPLRNWLNDPTIDFPFCLCWANEKWTRTWDGRGDEILIDQRHSPEDDIAFIKYIADYFRDPRYLRVGGNPLLLIYRPQSLPNALASSHRWREWCRLNKIGELHIAYVESFERPVPKQIGFDSAVEFPPNLMSLGSCATRHVLINGQFGGDIFDWRLLAAQAMRRLDPGYILHRCVNPGWDNEPRRAGLGRILVNPSPGGYGRWLSWAITNSSGSTDSLVFINAWNEWAEGAILEPDASFGYAYLEATRKSYNSASPKAQGTSAPCVVIHAWNLDVLPEILDELNASGIAWKTLITTSPEKQQAIAQLLHVKKFTADVEIYPNRGRDIAPFLGAINHLRRQGQSIVLKLHTKKSIHLANGDAWRRDLVNKLIAGGRAQAALAAFNNEPDLGMIAPESHLLPLIKSWGANKETLLRLCARIGAAAPKDSDVFSAGSMFWIRIDALEALLDGGLRMSEFEAEAGQIDGTMAHAIERLFAICTVQAGFSLRTTGSLTPAALSN